MGHGVVEKWDPFWIRPITYDEPLYHLHAPHVKKLRPQANITLQIGLKVRLPSLSPTLLPEAHVGRLLVHGNGPLLG